MKQSLRIIHAEHRALAAMLNGLRQLVEGIDKGRLKPDGKLLTANGVDVAMTSEPLAALLACSACGRAPADARHLAAAAELVHMATLLHDDVIDDGDERRGRPTSRRLWGNAVSVLAGDSLLVEALRLASMSHSETWTELLARYPRSLYAARARAPQ